MKVYIEQINLQLELIQNGKNLLKLHFQHLFLYSFSNVRVPYNTSRVLVVKVVHK